MSNSALVTYTRLSPNHTHPRVKKIERLTIHCFVGQVGVQQGADAFASLTRKASCNYVVAKDGQIGLVVDEQDRSWCSSSSDNDHRAITVEVASDTKAPYAITDAALNGLIELLADVCRRNGITKTVWIPDRTQALAYIPAQGEAIYTLHRWFANKECPGEYIISRLPYIRDRVNEKLGNQDAPKIEPYLVRVTASTLNIRKGPGTQYTKVGTTPKGGVYTIVEVQPDKSGKPWGRLKSGAGWIALSYTERV